MTETVLKIPEDFYKIIEDFVTDIKTTFPEYEGIISKWWKTKVFETEEQLAEYNIKKTTFVFKHCLKVYPERFFDILYKNQDIFSETSEVNTEFLPGIVFKQLWDTDISENTREVIWKYLQLILFGVVGSVDGADQFGDTAKLFEAINEDDLKLKMQEALEGMQKMFEQSENGENSDIPNLPNAEELHNHINGMMEGKLGRLAMELAEETAKDLNLDMDNVGSAQDVFQKLLKNPTKLMSMVQNVGSKLDAKIKSGEIKESEIISEGMEFLNKMKGMPGMENMQEMFSNMGIPGLGKGSKINMGAMKSKMNENLRKAKMKERMKEKIDIKDKMNELKQKITEKPPAYTDDELAALIGSAKPQSGKKSKKSNK